MLPRNYRTDFRDRLLSFLWRQWAQLGLASAQVEKRDGWAIDPEALLHLTAVMGRWDPRLFDESIDWLVRNARFFNVPRLKSLAKHYGFTGYTVCCAMARIASDTDSRLHWTFPVPDDAEETAPLFYSPCGDPMTKYGEIDDVFARFGYARGVVELRGLSRRFNPVMKEAALLRLRSLFGVSARAEILLYLLTHKVSHPSNIARETGFSQKNVQDTLVDMAASGVVHVAKLEGRTKSYFVREQERAPFLYVPDSPPAWVTWAPLFKSLEELWLGLSDQKLEGMEPLLLSSQLRRLMKVARPGIEAADFGSFLTDEELHAGEDYTDVFVEDVESLLGVLRA